MFQSSGKFYFGSSEQSRFRSVPKGSQYGGSKDFLSSFRPAHHNHLPKTILKGLSLYSNSMTNNLLKSFGHERARSYNRFVTTDLKRERKKWATSLAPDKKIKQVA